MPYASTSDLPPAVRQKLPTKRQRQWMHVWNSEYQAHHDEARAFAAAWAAVKQSSKVEKAMSEQNFTVFMPIEKIDKKKRTVSGYASTQTRDSDGEVISLQAVKAALPDYMSFGNIREMHKLSAVGTETEEHTSELQS